MQRGREEMKSMAALVQSRFQIQTLNKKTSRYKIITSFCNDANITRTLLLWFRYLFIICIFKLEIHFNE